MNKRNVVTKIFELLKLSIVISYFLLVHFDNLIAQNPIPLNGFPIHLDSAISISPRGSSPIISDFNKDGNNEILFAYYRGGVTSKIYLMSSDGTPLNGWPILLSGIRFITAAGDVNGDGYIDIVLRSSDSVFVFDYSGNRLTGFPVYFSAGNTRLLLYDLDNNNNLEVITVGYDKAIVFNSSGLVRPGWPVILPGVVPGITIPDISAADLNHDGTPEVIIPSTYFQDTLSTINEINIFEPDGKKYLSSPIVSDSNYHFAATPVSIYFKNDSGFITVNSNYESSVDTKARTSIYNQRGNLIKRFYTSFIYNTSGSISLGDVNEDKILDLSFGYQSFLTYLFTTDGGLFNGWPVDANSFFYRSPVLLRFTNQDLIIATESRADTIGGYSQNHGYFKFYDQSGIQTNWSPLRLIGSPETSGTMCDLNKDGSLDMVVLSSLAYFVGISIRYESIIHAWTFPGVQYSQSNLYWPMYGHDRYRTFQYGFVPPDEPVGIQPINSIIPSSYILYQNYPNPFNPSTNIKFDIPNAGFVCLKVFDALGKEVSTLLNEKLGAGTYNVLFSDDRLSSGIYFYTFRLEDSYIETKKMLLIR